MALGVSNVEYVSRLAVVPSAWRRKFRRHTSRIILGFIALLLGALFNAHLNRTRDDALREADRKAVASALKAELASIQGT